MPESGKDLRASTGANDNLLPAYQAACERHHQIDDFRGKLLALLPIASGAAGLLLLSKSDTWDKYLTPIGIYGFAATLGLFVYELYGISNCKRIMDQAGDLEDKLDIPKGMGQFRDRPKDWLHLLIGAEMASWIVYLSVLGGWLYVAGVSKWWHHVSPWYLVGTVALILLVRGQAIAFPDQWRKKPRWRHRRPETAGEGANATPLSSDEAETVATGQPTSV
jgi:hypothetical protein